MKLLYSVDAVDNLFPSIHCLVSWFCWIGIRKRPDIPMLQRYFSLAVAVAVCLSTLTTKQHVITDVIGGVALAKVSYISAENAQIRGVYSKSIFLIKCKLLLQSTASFSFIQGRLAVLFLSQLSHYFYKAEHFIGAFIEIMFFIIGRIMLWLKVFTPKPVNLKPALIHVEMDVSLFKIRYRSPRQSFRGRVLPLPAMHYNLSLCYARQAV